VLLGQFIAAEAELQGNGVDHIVVRGAGVAKDDVFDRSVSQLGDYLDVLFRPGIAFDFIINEIA
jgi:hypothetical protein